MRQSFTLQIESFSINSTYYRDRSMKRPEAVEWGCRVMHQLSDPKISKKLEAVREAFDPKKHHIHVKLKFKYPKKLLFTKAGTLSARVHDLSNIEKLLIDHVFLPTYFDKPSPYGCKNLNIDDKFISRLTSDKSQSKDDLHYIHISISIHRL